MASSTVRWFDSSFPGAPQLNDSAGSACTVLDACLINGFNTTAASSLSVADGIATITIDGGHLFPRWSWIRVTGATNSILNDDFQINAVTLTTLSFRVVGVANGPDTGTINIAFAPPGGWEIAYTGTSLRSYRSTASGASGRYLAVDDTLQQYGAAEDYRKVLTKVTGYETMSAVATGTNPFFLTGANYWLKSGGLTTSARRWTIVCDDRMLYFVMNPDPGQNVFHERAYCFGDYISNRPGNTFNVILVTSLGNMVTSPTSSYYYSSNVDSAFAQLTNSLGKTACRASNNATLSVAVSMFGSGLTSWCGYDGVALPNPADNQFLYNEIYIKDSVAIMGQMPGVFQSLHSTNLTNLAPIVYNQSSEKVFLPISITTGATGAFTAITTNNGVGQALFDITGPWR